MDFDWALMFLKFVRFCRRAQANRRTIMGTHDGGEIRGEALCTDRGCWFVCYPPSSTKCRLTNFKQDEMEHAQRALETFRELGRLGISDRAELIKVGGRIRSCLREDLGMSMVDILGAALAALGKDDILAVGAHADALTAKAGDMPAPLPVVSDPSPPPVAGISEQESYYNAS